MISNFIKIALRNFKKHKLHSFINIFGLAIGMSATIIIASFVFFELSYDKHNKQYDDIYRIYSVISLPNGESIEGPATIGTVAPEIPQQIPEVSHSVRMTSFREIDINYNDNNFRNDKLIWADTSFFDIFTFEFIAGNPKTALTKDRSLVLTESTAKTYFGDKDAFNKIVDVNGDSYKITGVIKDCPINSHFHFDILGSFVTVCNSRNNIVENSGFNFYTYLLCPDFETNKEKIEEKTNVLIKKISNERFGDLGLHVDSYFQKLKDIHLKSNSLFEIEDNGNINNIYIFSALAIFIILIAIVNFINLVTANSETRAKEIGLRKVMGANRNNLFRQFISESILISIFAFILSLGITHLFIDMFSQLMDTPIVLPYIADPIILIIMLIAVVIIGFISGSYPALYLSRYLPVDALKGSKSSGGTKNTFLRKSLVVFQFTIAIFLLVNLALLYKQVSFLKNKDLGFNKEQVLVVHNLSEKIKSSYKSLKADLLTNTEISSVTASQGVPGQLDNIEATYKVGDNPSSSIAIHEFRIQNDFIQTFGIQLAEGSDFTNDMGTSEEKVIINEAAVKKLGFDEPLYKKLIFFNDTLQIIGIVKDFHILSLREEIAPLSLTKRRSGFDVISIKLNTKDVSKTLKKIESAFSNVDPNFTFQYWFVDQNFEQMYKAEERSNKLITYAAILAIIISMLGLYALTSFTISQKVREIGIRKVMGATVGQIMRIFISDLVKLVLIAAIIAFSLSYYSMTKWLERFVYHTDISVWMFLFGGLTALIIAIVTVSFISYKAAIANPVDSIKYE